MANIIMTEGIKMMFFNNFQFMKKNQSDVKLIAFILNHPLIITLII